MDFIDEVRARSARFTKRAEQLKGKDVTEEATKTAFVLPFIQMLGYDIFNPAEVIPEFTADVGTKRGEKVDYALLKDGAPAVLIEAKKVHTKLDGDAVSQLLRYFGVTEARIGILTDGLVYRFFSDLDQSNVMDPRPFFEFNMLDFTEAQADELKRFTKDRFDKSQIEDAARDLRYTAAIKSLLASELVKPSDDFVKFVIKQVYDGRVTVSVRRMFRGLTFSAFNQFVSDKIQERFVTALKQEGDAAESKRKDDKEETSEPEFTEYEQGALNVLKAILGGIVQPACLGMRKNQRNVSIVLHGTPEKEDYGTVLFTLLARRKEFIKLSRRSMIPLRLDSIEDLFLHTDNLRRIVQGNDAIAKKAQAHDQLPNETD